MQCKCGAEVAERNHEVKTLVKAKDWLYAVKLPDSYIESKLPVTIEQHECKCGRYGFRVLSGKQELYSRI
jgi:hypothetical protein